ncbi:MAG: hypothetical protein ABIH70_02860 [Chloroflexota bacterium]
MVGGDKVVYLSLPLTSEAKMPPKQSAAEMVKAIIVLHYRGLQNRFVSISGLIDRFNRPR